MAKKFQTARGLIASFMLLAVLFGGLNVSLFAQTGTAIVKGSVVDTDGLPLTGAGIMVKGTSHGTITD
jgi:hypothetical protein